MKDLRRATVAVLLVPVLFLQMVLQAYALPTVVSLNVVRCEQQETNWCWAACAQMVGNYYGNSYSQGIIVYQVKGSFNNVGASDTEVSQAMNFVLPPGKSATCINTMSQDSMYTKLAQGYPIPIKMLWNSGGAHDVLITGYTSEGALIITDPWLGCTRKNSYSYPALVNGTRICSGEGRYIRTWLITS